MIVAAVVCSLLASMEQPDKISIALAATVLIAAVPVFATQFYLMPLAVDFPSMAVALAPLMLTCGFIMAQPRIGPLGLLSAVYFAFASNIDNVMTYDAVAFLNSSLAILVGIAVAVVLFATFFPETPAFAVRRFRRQLVVHLRYLVGASRCASALPCYQRALCEQLGETLARVKDEAKAARECFTSAITALSAAQAISRLGQLSHCRHVALLNRQRTLSTAGPTVADAAQSIALEIRQEGSRGTCPWPPCSHSGARLGSGGRPQSTERDHCRS